MCQCGGDARSMITWLTRKNKKYIMSVGRDTSGLGPNEAMLEILYKQRVTKHEQCYNDTSVTVTVTKRRGLSQGVTPGRQQCRDPKASPVYCSGLGSTTNCC